MCGLAGIFSYHYAAPQVDRDELQRIRDHMAARGPDGQGEWFSDDGRVGLAHRRLSIIDLTERGAQPMATADGSLVVTFNGEIYNYRVLRQQLEDKGYQFYSESDTEVLLHLYADRGEDMVHELRGMFAFALWDSRKQALFLARDLYGIKPLYYADDGWTLRLASQVKALRAGGRIADDLNPAGSVGFYLFGSIPEPHTIYQEIRALPAGTTLWVDATGPGTPRPYSTIAGIFTGAQGAAESTSLQDVQIQVQEALQDSVAHHLVADVPVGAFLSAGIDSGALVGLMRDAGQSDIQTVTLAFEEFHGRAENEAPLAEAVARQYETRHTTRVVTRTEFEADMPKILEAMDQPSIDGINTWFVSKAAQELGLKVAISGLGGDELFGGYPSFGEIPRWVRTLAIPSRIPFLGDIFRRIMTPLCRVTGHNPKVAGMLKYGGRYAGAYLLKRGLFMPWELPAVLPRDTVREGLRRLVPVEHVDALLSPDPRYAFARVASLEAGVYMRNQLLRDTDWTSMAHSLEVRVPLVDATLLRRLAPFLCRESRSTTKQSLARAPKQLLPSEVRARAKTGFTTPVMDWLQASSVLKPWERVAPLRSTHCPWARRWAYTIGDDALA